MSAAEPRPALAPPAARGAAGAGGRAAARAGGYADRPRAATSGRRRRHDAVPFHGAHQAGIATPAQDRLALRGVRPSRRRADRRCATCCASWTDAAARDDAPAGRSVAPTGEQLAPPDDTGEAVGPAAARLTITFGFGPSLFERDGEDRFGLRRQAPAALRDLPPLPGDELDPSAAAATSACRPAPTTRRSPSTRSATWPASAAAPRSCAGRSSASAARPRRPRDQETPRNLMGFKDGTNNIHAEDTDGDATSTSGSAPPTSPAWMRGGSYLVTRRIRMLIEVWDRSSLADQEQTIGRRKLSGAPLGGERRARHRRPRGAGHGSPVIPADAHIRLAAPGDERRRADPAPRLLASPTASTQRPASSTPACSSSASSATRERQFVAIQRRLGHDDALNEYIRHGAARSSRSRRARAAALRRRGAARLGPDVDSLSPRRGRCGSRAPSSSASAAGTISDAVRRRP